VARSEGRSSSERSGTHVGAGQPGGGEVGRDTWGPDGRAAVRSGGQPSDGEVGHDAWGPNGRAAVRSGGQPSRSVVGRMARR
jgi:hypothetical protein